MNNPPKRHTLAALARLFAAGMLAMAAVPSLQAQVAGYPNKPLKVIVPFTAGGGGDILARLVMTRVGRELGQPIVFENLAGAGGNVGSVTASKAPADGYTLLYGTNGTLAINQTIYKAPGFNPLKDLEPVSQLTQLAAMVVVRPNLPVSSMADLTKLLKANPGKYTFGSAGNGTTSHLAGEIYKASAGVSAVHIPYRGGAQAMTDLIGGQVDFMIEVMPNAAPQAKAGRVKPLAVTIPKRVPAWPDVPTVAESGLKGFDVSAWDAIMVPAGTPRPIVDRLVSAIHKAQTDPELRAQLQQRGADVAPTTPEELSKYIASNITLWGNAVKRSGAAVD
ncbi:MAG: tripartite tricarboxylate transporter substrate binding protein [Polaromonas sp.]|uniref:Bug family tripartite tricarboxylate transporter substrate binding protein n=1 Tax=Polaromonas sp. TaxID=1869339 RepID=UPI0025F65041|nr:tripartite tricarboxylate transporter substrate binding protein [Polaromonas sp.]MBI2728837.1 tripartite tricarboxylate transporter substrate binding protein [Polaromonas sp.]